jgi:hypothetical protein
MQDVGQAASCGHLFEYRLTSGLLRVQAYARTDKGAARETYTIVRRDGAQYFFDVTSHGGGGYIRDGRYAHAGGMAWIWREAQRDGSRTFGLTESVKYDWNSVADYYKYGPKGLGWSPPSGVPPPTDDTVLIQVSLKQGTWREESYTMEYAYGTPSRYTVEFRPVGKTVSTPAGSFDGCYERVQNFYGKGQIREWSTHTFWASDVGMVREFQVDSEGKLAYDLQLTAYKLAGE